MLKNDYRRALIMLRALTQGYSGHVRLERRTLMGTMSISVKAPSTRETLNAYLVGEHRDGCRVYPLGTMGFDMRGQAGMTATFQPRDMNGMDLDDYALVVVASTDDAGHVRIVMMGSMGTGREMEWNCVRDVVERAAMRRAPCPVDRLPEEDENQAEQDDLRETAPADEVPDESHRDESHEMHGHDAQESDESNRREVREAREAEEPDENRRREARETREAEEPDENRRREASETREAEEPDEGRQREAREAREAEEPDENRRREAREAREAEEADENHRCGCAVEDIQDEPEGMADAEDGMARSAAMDAGILPQDVWPEQVAELRRYFFNQSAEMPFEEEGFTFVRVPLPEETGMEYCYAGIHADGVGITQVCYAIPAEFEIEPPPGLEGYQWRGGDRYGYWCAFLDAADGHMLDR